MTTLGDKLKCLKLDANGNYETDHIEPHRRDNFAPINTVKTLSGVSGTKDLEYMFLLQQLSLNENSNSVVYTVEAADGGLFDVKFYKLAHRGDSCKYHALTGNLEETAQAEASLLHEKF